jgi:hypothetical protein
MSTVTSLDAARRLKSVTAAEHIEGAQWELADALVEDVPPSDTRVSLDSVPRGGRDGSLEALGLLAEQMRREGLDYSLSALRQYRATAIAWPDDTRVHHGAGFTVHRELRGREDRAAILRRLMEEHGGRVTQKQVRTWKQEQNPPKVQTWAERMRDRIAAVAKEAKTPEARDLLADLFTDAARELRRG